MKNSKWGFLSMRHKVKFFKAQSPKTVEESRKMCDIPYASVIDSIQYVVQCTRPDIIFVLSVMKGIKSMLVKHIGLLSRPSLVLEKGLRDVLGVRNGKCVVEGYSDASFQSDVDNAKS
ncbi:UNVERIFIED_CONTAM: hypothetical protein Slati_4165800 [Sesamum latifolium]|uniref:Uncharacterized protein n=1 Tax=Sesamum latifolium TaxID=2727402 RepID=A0AAW2TA23_9LAMI